MKQFSDAVARACLARKDDFLAQLQTFLAGHTERKWCVAAVDVEHFKLYNEWYGVKRGDKLLESLAACLVDVHNRQGCPVGYWGNDDFFLCLPDDETLIKKLYDELQKCIDVNESKVNFYVVLGLCPVEPGLPGEEGSSLCEPVPQTETWECTLPDASTLCNYAQIAVMSHTQGGSYICRFDVSMLDRLRRRQEMLTEIEHGLQNREFCFFLQPKCNSMTHRIFGMEALVRWKHPQRGFISPGQFIPLLEQTGQVTKLDLFIWESVCQTLHRWQEEGRNIVPISVNVSIADISSLNVAQVFSDLVEKYQLEPKFLSAEITESMVAQNIDLVQNTILGLHRKGFTVLMDDFGSGYSSLNMLKDTSVDVLKLDMKFVDFTPTNREKGSQIVESVVEMAHRLNMPVVAEGVETQDQVYMLQSMDCLYIQGYYFYKPMEVEQAEQLLSTRPDNESYWDLRRDMMLRDHQVLGHNHVSERTAVALQSYQIVRDNVLELSRINLNTGEYVVVARDKDLPGDRMEGVGTFAEYCERLIQLGVIDEKYVAAFRAGTNLEMLRKTLFETKKPVSTRFRGARTDREPSPLLATLLPSKNCSEQEPWAVLMILDLPDL